MAVETVKIGKKWVVRGTCICENVKGNNSTVLDVYASYKRKWEANAMCARWTKAEAENIEMNNKALSQRMATISAYLAVRAERARQFAFSFGKM